MSIPSHRASLAPTGPYLRSTAGSPSHTSFMLDEPRRQTLVLDSGRRSAVPLEHADARARFRLTSPSRRQESLRTLAARATRKCQHGQPRGSRSAGKTFSSAKTTGTRIPVGIVQVAMSANHTLARIRQLPPHPARRFPASRPTPASESVPFPELRSRQCRWTQGPSARSLESTRSPPPR
jgi:hypothetical protein